MTNICQILEGVVEEACWLLCHLPRFKLAWCFGECNMAAHQLAQHARFVEEDFVVWLEEQPDFLSFHIPFR